MALIERPSGYTKWLRLSPRLKSVITEHVRSRDPHLENYRAEELLALVTNPLYQESATTTLRKTLEDLARDRNVEQYPGNNIREALQSSVELRTFRPEELVLRFRPKEIYGILVLRHQRTSDSQYECDRNLLFGITNARLQAMKLPTLAGSNSIAYLDQSRGAPIISEPEVPTDPNSPLNNQLRAIINSLPELLP